MLLSLASTALLAAAASVVGAAPQEKRQYNQGPQFDNGLPINGMGYGRMTGREGRRGGGLGTCCPRTSSEALSRPEALSEGILRLPLLPEIVSMKTARYLR